MYGQQGPRKVKLKLYKFNGYKGPMIRYMTRQVNMYL